MANLRIFYGCQAVGIAPLGVNNFTLTSGLNGTSSLVHGATSVGVNTKFNLEQAFELGQSAIYQNIEGIPDIEITLEKHLDGYPLIFHMATQQAASPTLLGRANVKAGFALSVFSNSQDATSGTPLTTMFCSGIYVSSISYTFNVQGSATEQVTLVGNNKTWAPAASGGATFSGLTNALNLNQDQPASPIGISQRWHVAMYPGVASGSNQYTIFPTDVEGISSSGTNNKGADGNFGAHIQSIKVSANYGREAMLELGRKDAYFRYANVPVEVKTDIETYGVTGDTVQALAEATNLADHLIQVKSEEGTYIWLGVENKLQQVSYGGGNASSRGGNVSETYSYITFNDMTVLHPADPAGFAGW